jgi:hypothetical protein
VVSLAVADLETAPAGGTVAVEGEDDAVAERDGGEVDMVTTTVLEMSDPAEFVPTKTTEDSRIGVSAVVEALTAEELEGNVKIGKGVNVSMVEVLRYGSAKEVGPVTTIDRETKGSKDSVETLLVVTVADHV